MHALGIDIGGSGIKGAPVDVDTGQLLAPRQKIATPRPAKPEPVADVVKQLTTAFSWTGPAYRFTARNATPAVTVVGSPAELTLWVMGRRAAARVRMDGTEAAVSKLAANW